MRVLLKYKQDLFVRNGLLYRKVKLKNHDTVVNQFVLPKTHRQQATLALHDDYGHLGLEKTLGLLQERFFWPKMVEDVWSHIRTCERCTKYKQQPEREKLKPISCTYPLELVHLNFLTIGKEGTAKAINIMVITDHFSRYTQAYITPKQTAPVVAKTLWDQFLVHYGWPTKILMDQGKSFENQLIQELCSLAQVQTLHTTPYRPQTNGSYKHFNFTLMSMLGTLPVHTKKNWPEWVSTLTHTYNATMCHATGFSPFFLMYGRIPILPIDVEFGVMVPDITHASHQNYTEKLKAHLKWAYKVARENNDQEAARHKQYYDQKFKCMKMVPGDLVLVRVKAFGPDHKIADRWEQVPYRVLSQHNNSPVYKVQPINENMDEGICTLHRNMLFPLQSIREDENLGQNDALVQADLAMMRYFS